MALFQDYEFEREDKLLSLGTDRVAQETGRLWKAMKPLGLSLVEQTRIENTLTWAKGQVYGTRTGVVDDRYYIAHPIRVARFLSAWFWEQKQNFPVPGLLTHAADAICAALLHTTLEKNLMSPEDVREQFGEWVLDALTVLTPDRARLENDAGKREYYQNLGESSVEVRAIKIFDKLDNLFVLNLNPNKEIRSKYVDEIATFLRPVAEKTTAELLPYFDEMVLKNRV